MYVHIHISIHTFQDWVADDTCAARQTVLQRQAALLEKKTATDTQTTPRHTNTRTYISTQTRRHADTTAAAAVAAAEVRKGIVGPVPLPIRSGGGRGGELEGVSGGGSSRGEVRFDMRVQERIHM